ncbi:MAG: hypothetical protein ABI759_18145 [Candidatus Solibacter sp.]
MATRSQFAVKLLPSLADFAFLMPIAFLFGRMNGAKALLGDCDTGWHIRTGEWILANGWVPTHDIFSFSKPGARWYAWEWLSDIIFARITALGGLQLLVLCTILMLSVTFTALYFLVRRKSNAVIAVVITMLAGAGSSIHWLARPHLFTLLFLVIFYAALERVAEGRTHLAGLPILALFPVVTILWTNLHGGFFVGALMILAYGAGEILRGLFTADPAERQPAFRLARGYILSGLGCFAASLLNPYTYHLHVHMLQYLRDPWNSQHIQEFLSPTFHHPTAIFFEMMLLLAVGAAIWNLRSGRFTETVLAVMWAHAALLAARNIPIFMIAAAPIAGAAIQQWLLSVPRWNVAGWMRAAVAKFNRVVASTAETEAIPRWHLVSALGLAVVAALLYAPHPPKMFRAEFDPNVYPAAALATLRSDPTSRVFTNDEWGDYLIYRLYPGHKVFVDGRSDFYGNDFEEKYIDVLNVRYGWEKTLTGFGVDTILLSPTAPLSGALKESSRWRVVYDDGIAVVFRTVERDAQVSVAGNGGGASRDREITKTKTGDESITRLKANLKL